MLPGRGFGAFAGQFYPGASGPGSGVVVPAQITANQNNYSPPGFAQAATLLLTSDQPRSITGIAGGRKGRALIVVNSSTNVDGDIVLRAESASSTAANRFTFDTDIVLEPSESIFLIYDHVNSRWKRGASRRYTGGTFRRNPYYVADFLGPAGAATTESPQTWDVALFGTASAQAKIAGTANHPGILRLTSGTTANSGVSITTSADAILLAGGERAEFVFQLPVLTTITVRLGFFDTTTSADAVDGAYIEIPATGAAVGKTASNSVRTTSATIATLSAATWYLARIEVRKDLSGVDFYIFDDNGNLLGTQSNTTNLPTAAGRETGHGAIYTNSGTVAVAGLQLDFMSIEFTRALV